MAPLSSFTILGKCYCIAAVWLFLDGTVLVYSFLFCSNPTFSYRVDGDRAVYLGRGDHHDPKFDGMAVSSMLKDLEEFSLSRSSYSGVPLNEDYYPFTFWAYPSATMEAQYVTTNPIFFTVGMVAIFCFTSLVFAIFDWTVERRQRKVMSTAGPYRRNCQLAFSICGPGANLSHRGLIKGEREEECIQAPQHDVKGQRCTSP
jgi:nitrate reductase gamma subunit